MARGGPNLLDTRDPVPCSYPSSSWHVSSSLSLANICKIDDFWNKKRIAAQETNVPTNRYVAMLISFNIKDHFNQQKKQNLQEETANWEMAFLILFKTLFVGCLCN